MKNPTWYHVIDGYKGNDHWFMPKVPETATKVEGNIPRICVSDSINKCIRSITGVNHPTIDDLLFSFKTNPAVYMSIQEVQPFLPPDILDFRYNNEHWFIHDTLFAFIGFMNISTLITEGEIVLSNDYELNVPYYSDGRKILNL